jgi:hypothetical protein
MFFKKKPFVRFVNVMPGVELAHPVIKSQDAKFNWIRNASLDFKETTSNNVSQYNFGSVTRCPGLGQLFKTGFIITAPMDFLVTTDRTNLKEFKWNCTLKMIDDTYENPTYIGSHSYDQLAKFMPFRDDTLQTLVKVNTGWRISSSEDIVFLQMPIPYPDHNAFTASHGIIDASQQLEINVQLFWHKLDGTTIVKAGTPLCQLIPIPRHLAVDLIVETPTEEDKYVFKAWAYLAGKEFNRDFKSFMNASKKLLSRGRK